MPSLPALDAAIFGIYLHGRAVSSDGVATRAGVPATVPRVATCGRSAGRPHRVFLRSSPMHPRMVRPSRGRSDHAAITILAVLGSCTARREVTSEGGIIPAAGPSIQVPASWRPVAENSSAFARLAGATTDG